MNIINYISIIAMPLMILIIISCSLFEKNKVYDHFLNGAKEGVNMVFNLVPTLIGLFVAVGCLRNSGILDFIINLILPIIEYLKIPKEILPLAILRPISGSASMAVATDIMKEYGVDTYIGKLASVIMGSTETTLYAIAVYTSCVHIKNTKGILWVALLGDIVCVIVSIFICSII